MKYFYALITFLLIGFSSSAQYAAKPMLAESNKLQLNNNPMEMELRSSAAINTDTIMYQDFNDGFPQGWSMVDNTDNDFDWVLTDDEEISAQYTNTPRITSTSDGNYMLLFGDSYNPGSPPYEAMDAYFQTDSISMGDGYEKVSLYFQQKFRECCDGENPSMNVLVSTDPTFPEGDQTMSYDANTSSVAINTLSEDPEYKKINISAIAGGNYTGNIYLRFHKTINSHYFWMIDDILILPTDNNDLQLNGAVLNMTSSEGGDSYRDFYGRTPLSQVSDIEYGMLVYNYGVYQQNSVTTTIDVSGDGTFTDSQIYSLDSLASDSSYLEYHSNHYTPDVIGEYTNVFTVSADSADDNSSDNQEEVVFSITDSVFSPDYSYEITGSVGTNYYPDGFKAANLIELVTADDLSSVTIRLSGNTIPGGSLQIAVSDTTNFTNNGSTPIMYSEFYTVTDADTANREITLPIPTQYNGVEQNRTLEPGAYYISVECYSNNNMNDIIILDDMTYQYRGYWSSIIYADNTQGSLQWFTNGIALAIRANFGEWEYTPPLSINDYSNAAFKVFPNPSNGSLKLNFNSTGANASVLVYDLSGKCIYHTEIATYAGVNNQELSLSHLTNGSYVIVIDNGTNKHQGKINIIK